MVLLAEHCNDHLSFYNVCISYNLFSTRGRLWLIAQINYEPTSVRTDGAGHRAHYGKLFEPLRVDRYFRQVFPVSANWIYYQAGDTLSKWVVLEPEEVVRFSWELSTPTLPFARGGREQSQVRKSQISTKWIC